MLTRYATYLNVENAQQSVPYLHVKGLKIPLEDGKLFKIKKINITYAVVLESAGTMYFTIAVLSRRLKDGVIGNTTGQGYPRDSPQSVFLRKDIIVAEEVWQYYLGPYENNRLEYNFDFRETPYYNWSGMTLALQKVTGTATLSTLVVYLTVWGETVKVDKDLYEIIRRHDKQSDANELYVV